LDRSAAGSARNLHGWVDAADETKRASDLLRDQWITDVRSMADRGFAWIPPVVGPAMTLAAFAIENLLKGLAVVADPSLIQPSKDNPQRLIAKELATHDLNRLARMGNVDLSADESQLLGKLTESIQWAGRYPSPKDATESAPRAGAPTGGASYSSEWFPTLDQLFERLRATLWDAAVLADREQQAATVTASQDERPRMLAELESLAAVAVEPGVTVFETELPEEQGSQVVCVACGARAHLNPHRPAMICRCGTLYRGEKRGVAGRIIFTVDTFPADNSRAS
jgi:hypothetical protein